LGKAHLIESDQMEGDIDDERHSSLM